MASVTDIFNLALSQLGKPEVTSPDDNTAAAAWCRRAYPVALRETLARSDWVFARGAVPLVGTAIVGHPQFPYQYAKPADFVKVRAIGQGEAPLRRGVSWVSEPYELSGAFILGLSPSAVLWYTRYIVDPDQWCPLFDQAVAFKTASLIGVQATGRADTAVNLQKLYENQLVLAIEADASQERTVWTRSEQRIGGGYVPHGALPDYPYDDTMIWGPGPGTGTPVSDGGGAVPAPGVVYVDREGTPFDFVSIYEQAKQ